MSPARAWPWPSARGRRPNFWRCCEANGLLSGAIDIAQPLPPPVAAAVHAFVCSVPALLALVQADDLAGELVAVNLPGTDRERPNWQRRLGLEVDDLFRTKLADAILTAMKSRVAGAAK